MKKIITTLCLFVLCLFAWAQETDSTFHVGYLSYNEALKAMPQYAAAQKSLDELKATYEAELERSEKDFSKLFEEYVDGHQSFPENILLKRQKELQQLMEQTMAFKEEAKRLLDKAEAELMLPVEKELNERLAKVGKRKGLAFILNTDNNNVPWISLERGEDITADVIGGE